MTFTTIARRLGAGIVITAASIASLTACGDYTPPGELGENQRILATCPKDQKLNQTTFLDMSGTSLGEQIKAERLEIVGQLARSTAVCGGHLSVTAFSSGSAATVSLYNGDLDLDGATTEGRLNRVPAKVNEVVAEISAEYDEAAPQLPSSSPGLQGPTERGSPIYSVGGPTRYIGRT